MYIFKCVLLTGFHLTGTVSIQKYKFLLRINVALLNFALKSISEAVGAPDGQVWAISGPHVVRDG